MCRRGHVARTRANKLRQGLTSRINRPCQRPRTSTRVAGGAFNVAPGRAVTEGSVVFPWGVHGVRGPVCYGAAARRARYDGQQAAYRSLVPSCRANIIMYNTLLLHADVYGQRARDDETIYAARGYSWWMDARWAAKFFSKRTSRFAPQLLKRVTNVILLLRARRCTVIDRITYVIINCGHWFCDCNHVIL